MVPIIFWDFQEVEINGKKYFQQSIINKQSWQTTHNIVPFQPSGHDRKERQYFCRKVWILIGVTWYWKSATYQKHPLCGFGGCLQRLVPWKGAAARKEMPQPQKHHEQYKFKRRQTQHIGSGLAHASATYPDHLKCQTTNHIVCLFQPEDPLNIQYVDVSF